MNCDGEMAISQITGMNRDVIQEICDKVRDFPPLYNVNHALYRDSNVKMQIWHLIAQEIGWDVERLRLRWKSLRDRYRKELNMRRCGSDETLAKGHWRYFQRLHYLEPYIRDVDGYPASTSGLLGQDASQPCWSSSAHVDDACTDAYPSGASASDAVTGGEPEDESNDAIGYLSPGNANSASPKRDGDEDGVVGINHLTGMDVIKGTIRSEMQKRKRRRCVPQRDSDPDPWNDDHGPCHSPIAVTVSAHITSETSNEMLNALMKRDVASPDRSITTSPEENAQGGGHGVMGESGDGGARMSSARMALHRRIDLASLCRHVQTQRARNQQQPGGRVVHAGLGGTGAPTTTADAFFAIREQFDDEDLLFGRIVGLRLRRMRDLQRKEHLKLAIFQAFYESESNDPTITSASDHAAINHDNNGNCSNGRVS